MRALREKEARLLIAGVWESRRDHASNSARPETTNYQCLRDFMGFDPKGHDREVIVSY
jgi:hypothetical protein